MSRIGKKPIDIPAKVEVKLNGLSVHIKGPKGELMMDRHPDMAVKVEDNQILVERPTDQRMHRSLHGLTRSLIGNMVTGVSEGFVKTLEIEGVGYQAELQGKNLNMKLGFSHPVVIEPPAGIEFEVPKDDRGRVIHIKGVDKQMVGQVAANIRKLRPPEPYKGKGVRYRGERIIRKAGKAGKK
ncbi:MAG: 50S ribosomal protein L6 [Chloroflexota bacterium]